MFGLQAERLPLSIPEPLLPSLWMIKLNSYSWEKRNTEGWRIEIKANFFQSIQRKSSMNGQKIDNHWEKDLFIFIFFNFARNWQRFMQSPGLKGVMERLEPTISCPCPQNPQLKPPAIEILILNKIKWFIPSI